LQVNSKIESKRLIPDVSIIVCTLNRAGSLKKTISSLINQTLGDHLYEILIIDNGSSDHTRKVVEEYKRESSVRILYLFEEKIGLSTARNRGVGKALGNLIVFIDDDALADRALLSTFVKTFSADKELVAAGGAVEILGPIKLPVWLPRRLISHLSIVNYGTHPKFLKYPYYPFGTNMAFRREIFKRIGLFNNAFGRKGMQSFNTCEETDLFMRIEQLGEKIYYQPEAIVYHAIHPEQLFPDWICQQSYHIAYSCALIERKAYSTLHIGVKVMISVAGIAAACICLVLGFMIRSEYLRFYSICILSHYRGYIVGIMNRLGNAYNLKKGN